MRVQTFKEKFREQFFRNRTTEGGSSFIFKDEVDGLLGVLVMEKVPATMLDEIVNLNSLAYIIGVEKNELGYNTNYVYITKIFGESKDESGFFITVKERVHINTLRIINKSILTESWFADKIKDRLGLKPNLKNVEKAFKRLVLAPFNITFLKRVSHLYHIDCLSHDISSLDAKYDIITTYRNTLKIENTRPYIREDNRYTEFRIRYLTNPLNDIREFMFKDEHVKLVDTSKFVTFI